jgi:hypothetical protein
MSQSVQEYLKQNIEEIAYLELEGLEFVRVDFYGMSQSNTLLEQLKSKAVEMELLEPETEITAETAFTLVRDMPYRRASSREPETTIREWSGTCSGKHYLLKALFEELGIKSRLIACTTVATINPKDVAGKLRSLLEESNGRFVDVHNYLILELPDGDMIVDATWPITTKGLGTVVNEHFVLGENHKIACEPIEIWEIPEGSDPQGFKDELLADNFTPQELEHREKIIATISRMSNNPWLRLIMRVVRFVKGLGLG